MNWFTKILFKLKKRNLSKKSLLKNSLDKLKKNENELIAVQAHLEFQIEHEILNIQKNGINNKTALLTSLKRKKLLEKKLGQIDSTLTRIEYQREIHEKHLTAYNCSINKSNRYMSKDDVKQILKDLAIYKKREQDFTIALTNSRFFDTHQDNDDDDEFEKELLQLEEKISDDSSSKSSNTVLEKCYKRKIFPQSSIILA